MINVIVSSYLGQLCMFALVAGYILYYFTKSRRYNFPPGPPALPLIGNLHQFKTKLLHKEIFEKWVGKYGPVVRVRLGRNRLPGADDLPNLCYTAAVLRESMRVGTVLPSGVIHVTTCDTTIAEYKIPKGTAVGINHWALHHDPNVWEDVDRFDPERFLDENGKLAPKPSNWLPFSAGLRVCIGETVAKPEVLLIFATLLQQYKWCAKEGSMPDMSPDGSLFQQIPKPYEVVTHNRY